MKQTSLWLGMLIFFTLMMMCVAFPRVALAAEAFLSVQESHFCEIGNAPADEPPSSIFAQLDVSDGAETEDHELHDEGIPESSHALAILRLRRAGRLTALAPPLRSSQEFVGMHDKVPR